MEKHRLHGTFWRTYLIGATIVWAGTLLAVAIILAGSSALAQVLPILMGGAVWFILIIPAAWSRQS